MSWFGRKTTLQEISQSVKKKFVPKSDITTYEMAYILSKISPWNASLIYFTQEQWDQLEPQYKRHFEDIT